VDVHAQLWAQPRRTGNLDDLAWLIDDWVDESEDATVHTNWQWAKNENYE
jgi:hypothetical protein